VHGDDGVIDLASDEEDQARMEIRNKLRDKNFSRAVERRGGNANLVRVSVGKRSVTAYFDKDLARSKASVQPRIDTTLLEGSREKLGQAWAKWFHANDILGITKGDKIHRRHLKDEPRQIFRGACWFETISDRLAIAGLFHAGPSSVIHEKESVDCFVHRPIYHQSSSPLHHCMYMHAQVVKNDDVIHMHANLKF